MLSEIEIWNRIKMLIGHTLHTFTELEPNTIIIVEDTNSSQDAVIIKERATRPIKEDIIAAYQFLYKLGELERGRDLAWLAGPEKKTSSIIFRMVGEIAKDEIEVVKQKHKTILRLKEGVHLTS